ncbi:putative maf-like protein [Helianthus annuus]|nr:putative maf-like protein [Helianthus annuus]
MLILLLIEAERCQDNTGFFLQWLVEKSYRRWALISQFMAADIDEMSIRREKPEDLVLALAEAKVYFHDIPEEVIDRLIDDGVTLNVAGGLMLEHPLTAPFVDTVIGTPDGVMGLSKSLTQKLLEESLPVLAARVQDF